MSNETFTISSTSADGSTLSGVLTLTPVVAPPVIPIISKISVAPYSVTLVAGATQQFSAQAFDQNGALLVPQPAFTWAANENTVSQSGLFTAPMTAGNAIVSAASGSVIGSASVTVTAAPPNPPPIPDYTATIDPINESVGVSGLPCWKGQANSNDAWLASLPMLSDGSIDFTGYILAAVAAGKAAYIAASPLNWASLSGVKQYTDFNSAIASGATCYLWPRGQNPTLAMVNQNLGDVSNKGTAASPIIVTSIGQGGYADRSLPDPVMPNGFGLNDGRPGHLATHYVYVSQLEFSGNGQSQAIGFTDCGTGASDHVLLTNLRIHGFTTGVVFNGGNAYQSTNLLVYRSAIHDNYSYNYGVFTYGWSQVDILQSVIANNGWNEKVAPKYGSTKLQGHYDGVTNPLLSTDPMHRCIDSTLAANNSSGAQFNVGVLVDSCVITANPIGIVAGGGYKVGVNNTVFDGNNTEFDKISSVGTLNNGKYTVTASGTPGCALAMGPFGFPPKNTGAEYGLALKFDCAASGSFATGCIFTNKPDSINSNPAIQVNTVDQGKTPPLVTTVANPIAFTGCKVHNYLQWPVASQSSTTGGPNVVGISNQDGNPPIITAMPTLLYMSCVFPGVTGVSGVSGTEPNYVDSSRTVSAYAKTLGLAGVVDGPSFLSAQEANCIAPTWNPSLASVAAVAWIAAGFSTAK